MAAFSSDHPGLERLFAAIDRRDAAAFVDFLTPAARFRFGNAPEVVGRDDIERAVAAFFSSIAACRHRLRASWFGPDGVVAEGEVRYQLADGATVDVPFVNVLELDGERIAAYRIYIDNAPLFDAMRAAHAQPGGTQ